MRCGLWEPVRCVRYLPARSCSACQGSAVAGVLNSLLPEDAQKSFKNLFPVNKVLGCQLVNAALVMSLLLPAHPRVAAALLSLSRH